jgi:hypothetical protein
MLEMDPLHFIESSRRRQGGVMSVSRTAWSALGTVVLGAAVVSGLGVWIANAQPHQKPLVATPDGTVTVVRHGHSVTMPRVTLKLATFPDSLEGVHGSNGGPHPDWVTYSNDNLVVPAHAEVVVTIDQYDSGGPLNNSFFGNVFGTVGGTATVNGRVVRHVDPSQVGHTFTLRGIPGNSSTLFVSVPLPLNPSSATPVQIGAGSYPSPVVVTFKFFTGDKGQYAFNCEFPCGETRIGQFGEAMSTFGYMSGTLTVK